MYDYDVLMNYVIKFYKCSEKLASTIIKSAIANNDINGLMTMVGYNIVESDY